MSHYMKVSATNTLTDEITALPAVRIDAENGIDSSPIREYLEIEGCQVFVGAEPHLEKAYHIVFGTYGFVKSIVTKSEPGITTRYILLIDGTREEARSLMHAKTKIILLDDTARKTATVGAAFSFFFTGKSPVLDMRRYQKDKTSTQFTRPVIIKLPKKSPFSYDEYRLKKDSSLATDTLRNDKERIADLVHAIFWPKRKQKKTFGFALHRFLLGRKQLMYAMLAEDPVITAKRKVRARRMYAICIVACLFPYVWYVVSLIISSSLVAATAYFLNKGEITSAVPLEKHRRYWMYQAKASLGIVSFPFVSLGKDTFVRGQERIVAFVDTLGKTEEGIVALASIARATAPALFSKSRTQDDVLPIVATDQIKITLSSLGELIGTSQAELTNILETKTFPFSHPAIASQGHRIYAVLGRARDVFRLSEQMVALYPLVSGFTQKQSYLVLLQNSTELRPTGGFIGSIGLVTASEGNITDLSVEDVYTLDGQLKGHVDPPDPVRILLGQEHWYLRDSNWDPDFRKSAAQAAWFYEKESGLAVDGVIGISLPLVVDVLRMTGPIVLSDFNERITADNFIGKTLYYTQSNFFPGSTQKKDFLGSLLTVLLETLTRSNTVSPKEMIDVLANGFARRDILLYFQNSVPQQLVELYGWAGEIPGEAGCVQDQVYTCMFDPQYVVEANLGVNKVNYFIKRTQANRIVVRHDGSIKKTSMRTIRNTFQKPAKPPGNANDVPSFGGTYRTYTRFIIPRDSKVQRISINGKEVRMVGTKQQNAVLPYADILDDGALWLSVGIAFDVPEGEDAQAAIEYTQPAKTGTDAKDISLEIFDQKQPGVSEFPIETIVEYPLGWNAQFITQGDSAQETILANEGRLKYNTTLRSDVVKRIRFTR